LDGIKTKAQLLDELIRMQKDIEEKVEAQQRFISRFQLLVQNDGLFSQLIDNLPYPVAIFKQGGMVCMANKALISEAEISEEDISSGKINFLNRITDENYTVLDAAEDVFLGETTLLKNLVSPLTLFCQDESRSAALNTYQNAVFFPVRTDDRPITHGVVMLTK